MIPSSNKSTAGTVAEVCSDYLCGLCPFDLLKNTSANQGSCPKVHSDETKKVYLESLSSDPLMSVNNDHLRSLEATLAARDLKVDKAKRWQYLLFNDNDRARNMKDQIEKLELRISKCDLSRDVTSQDFAAQRSLIKDQSRLCEQLQQSLERPSSTKQRQLRICEVCGCYVDQDLSGERKFLHEKPNGIHDAYIKIAAKVTELKNSK